MLGFNSRAFKGLCFQHSDSDDLFSLLGKRERIDVGYRTVILVLDGQLQLLTQVKQVNMHGLQNLYCQPLAFANEAEQQMLGANEVITQAKGFLAAIGNDFLDFW